MSNRNFDFVLAVSIMGLLLVGAIIAGLTVGSTSPRANEAKPTGWVYMLFLMKIATWW